MKALFDRKQLAEAFAIAAGVAPTRSPKPILMGVKLTANDTTTISATDLELGVTLAVAGAKVDEPGAVVLPTARVAKILGTTDDAELSLTTDGTTLTVRGLRSKFDLAIEDAALFPATPEPEGDTVVMAADDLRRIIRRTIFATDVESPRYALGGVRLAATEGGFVGVATDGRRLATQALDGPIKTERTPVLPIKALRLIERTCEGDAAVALTLGATAAWLAVGGTTIYTRLAEGRYPDYRQVFPAGPADTARTTAGALAAAVVQAAIVTSDETRAVDFAFGPDLLTLTAQAADVGGSRVDLPIAYAGAAQSVSFDPRYLADALKPLDADAELTIELRGPKTATVLRSADGWTYVLMSVARDR